MSGRSRRSDDEGFTLIELAVVILIIGVLLAIAIPTFLGVRARSQNRRVQTELRNGYVSASIEEIPTQIYTQNAASLTALESAVTWVTGVTPAATGIIYVSVPGAASDGTGREIYLAGRSETGTCFYIHHDAGGGEPVQFATDSGCGDSPTRTYSAAPW